MFNFLKKKEVPKFPEGFLERAAEKSRYTPDVHYIERRLYHRFFIVDDLQSTMKNTHLLGSSGAKIAPAVSVYNMAMVKKRAGEHTTAIPLTKAMYEYKLAPVHGELYAVRYDQIYVLDKHKLNTVEFNRVRVPIFIPCAKYQKTYDLEGKPSGFVHAGWYLDGPYTAWMYQGNLDYWTEVFNSFKGKMRVKSSDWEYSVTRFAKGAVFSSVKMFNPKKIEYEPYYRFTPLEYDDNRFKPIDDPKSYSVYGLRKFRRKN